MSLLVNQLSVLLFVLSAGPCSPQIPYSQLQSHSLPGQVDMWTKHHTGCVCPHNILDHTCACCAQGGCHCGLQNRMRCVQCGLEEGCGQSKYTQNRIRCVQWGLEDECGQSKYLQNRMRYVQCGLEEGCGQI